MLVAACGITSAANIGALGLASKLTTADSGVPLSNRCGAAGSAGNGASSELPAGELLTSRLPVSSQR